MFGSNIVVFVVVFAALCVVSLAGFGRIEGYFSGKTYFNSADCANDDIGGFIYGSFGNCVKIFNGPEDPTTSLTSYKISEVIEKDGKITYSKQYFSDGSCDVPEGAAQSLSLDTGKCSPSNSASVTTSSASYMFTNTSIGSTLPTVFPVDGLSVKGYQEYNYCSQNIRAAYEYIYPNNYCYASSGRTKTGVTYQSFSYHCSGPKLTKSFYSSNVCAGSDGSAPVYSTTSTLGTVDTTCYTNMLAEFDYNLFETSTCVSGSEMYANKPTRKVAADSKYSSSNEFKTFTVLPSPLGK